MSEEIERDRAEGGAEDGLLGRLEVIEAQPLPERAVRFERLHDELLAMLQQSDRESGR